MSEATVNMGNSDGRHPPHPPSPAHCPKPRSPRLGLFIGRYFSLSSWSSNRLRIFRHFGR